MTSHAGRLYALALALVVFFLAWAVVAARPWQAAPAADPRLKALAQREARLRHEARLVKRVVARRFAVYHRQLRARRAEIAAAKARAAAALAASYAAAPVASSPSVQVVTLPPLTITRTS
jgi:hypothetical protein